MSKADGESGPRVVCEMAVTLSAPVLVGSEPKVEVRFGLFDELAVKAMPQKRLTAQLLEVPGHAEQDIQYGVQGLNPMEQLSLAARGVDDAMSALRGGGGSLDHLHLAVSVFALLNRNVLQSMSQSLANGAKALEAVCRNVAGAAEFLRVYGTGPSVTMN